MNFIIQTEKSLFSGFHRFHHADPFQLAVHHQVYQGGEDDGQEGGENITGPFNGPAEHNHIHFRGPYHKRVEENPKYQADRRADKGKNAGFPVNISGNLLVIEAQHLNGGDFLSRSVMLMFVRL